MDAKAVKHRLCALSAIESLRREFPTLSFIVELIDGDDPPGPISTVLKVVAPNGDEFLNSIVLELGLIEVYLALPDGVNVVTKQLEGQDGASGMIRELMTNAIKMSGRA